MLNRRLEREALGGAELAWKCELLCAAGIRLRADGWCLGTPLPDEIGVRSYGIIALGRHRRAAHRFERHLSSGHDDGCAALGIPQTTIRRLMIEWDRAGASTLVLEAVGEATTELLRIAEGGVWRCDVASDAISYALRSRITPRAPQNGSAPPPDR